MALQAFDARVEEDTPFLDRETSSCFLDPGQLFEQLTFDTETDCSAVVVPCGDRVFSLNDVEQFDIHTEAFCSPCCQIDDAGCVSGGVDTRQDTAHDALSLVSTQRCFGAGLIVNGKAVDHRRACLVEAENIDVRALAAELQDRLVEAADC